MNDLIKALEECLHSHNWHAALFVALSLPDICGKIETPLINSSQQRYAEWFNKYVSSSYKNINSRTGQENIFLSGKDCYALRCAYFHEGVDDITMQRAREAVEKFHFIDALTGMTIHCNMNNTKLQLQVDIFCTDVKNGVNNWLDDVANDADKQTAMSRLLTIQLPNPGDSMVI